MLSEATTIVGVLPSDDVGTCVMRLDGLLYSEAFDRLPEDLAQDRVRFHRGSIRGAYPRPVGP